MGRYTLKKCVSSFRPSILLTRPAAVNRFRRKFILTFALALLCWATANSLSYFVRSEGWGNLLGTDRYRVEAMGFPWLIWGEGSWFRGYYFDRRGLTADASIAVATSFVVGLGVALFASRGRPNVSERAPGVVSAAGASPWQFSLSTLLIATTVVSIVLSGIRTSIDSLWAILLFVYVCSPSLMVVVAQLSRRRKPVERILAVLLTDLALIVAAAVLAEYVDGIGDWTKGIMGIFVCWIPQFTLFLAVAFAWGAVAPAPRLAAKESRAP